MAPNAADNDPTDVLSDEFGFRPEDVVVTGFSGRLPECDTVDEFRQKLYAGEDMVNGEPTRWPMGKVSSGRPRPRRFTVARVFQACTAPS